jgi:phosphatidylglycerophosphatase C
MNNKLTLAIFDFDGTITTRDTFNDLIIKEYGYWKFVATLVLLSPLIILYKLGLVPNHVPKRILFSIFFSGMTEIEFNQICKNYSLHHIDPIVRKEALKKIIWHYNQGHTLIIASASLDNWIRDWALSNHFSEILSTQIEVKKSKLTGHFGCKNCYGIEKVNRLLEKYPNLDNCTLYVYGDSSGDKELLKIADYSFFRRFSNDQ